MKKYLAIFCILFIAACQTTAQNQSSHSIDGSQKTVQKKKPNYNIFWDQEDHLKDLLKENNITDANILYAEQKEYFDKKPDKYHPILSLIAESLNAQFTDRIQRTFTRIKDLQWPSEQGQWTRLKNSLIQAKDLTDQYNSLALLNNPRYRNSLIDGIVQKTQALKNNINTDTESQFSQFDHFQAASFFDLYPLKVNGGKSIKLITSDVVNKRLERASTSEIEQFGKNYPADFLGEKTWQTLSNNYLNASLKESNYHRLKGKLKLKKIMEAISLAQKNGFAPSNIPNLKIGFMEATSRTLLDEKQLDFPAQIDIDLPFETKSITLEDALSDDPQKQVDYLIVLNVALAKASRRISGKESNRSTVEINKAKVDNPEYMDLDSELKSAQLDLQSAQLKAATIGNGFCHGFGCLANIIASAAAGDAAQDARDDVDELMGLMKEVPKQVSEPVYGQYEYSVASVKGTKKLTAYYYIIDRVENKFVKSLYDIANRRTFAVAYGVEKGDPDREEILRSNDQDQDVAEWEEAPEAIALSDLIAHYLEDDQTSEPLGSVVQLKHNIFEDKNKAIVAWKSQDVELRPQNDERFNSVVGVYPTSQNSTGSGFFVAPDIVLTNFHVVDNVQFVELRLFDGTETFGKVIAGDALLDLALIKVQTRGIPVQIYTDRVLDLGTTVEAIGNPKGLSFSITRGVVSAIRYRKTVAIRDVGGRDTLMIQTDTAINDGNSGGPLFYKNKVVGVNTQGRTDAQNISYAVHYSEFIKFLKEHIPSFPIGGLG